MRRIPLYEFDPSIFGYIKNRTQALFFSLGDQLYFARSPQVKA